MPSSLGVRGNLPINWNPVQSAVPLPGAKRCPRWRRRVTSAHWTGPGPSNLTPRFPVGRRLKMPPTPSCNRLRFRMSFSPPCARPSNGRIALPSSLSPGAYEVAQPHLTLSKYREALRHGVQPFGAGEGVRQASEGGSRLTHRWGATTPNGHMSRRGRTEGSAYTVYTSWWRRRERSAARTARPRRRRSAAPRSTSRRCDWETTSTTTSRRTTTTLQCRGSFRAGVSNGWQ